MVPSAFVFMDSFPVTPNGKVDRQALPKPSHDRPQLEEAFVAPRDGYEWRLARVWESVLGVKPIGIRDNFFDLGGTSLAAANLFARIEKQFGKKLPLSILLEGATIERLSGILREERRAARQSSLVPIQPRGHRPPLFLAHGIGVGVLHYRGLASHLGPDQPVYGLQPHGLAQGEVPFTRIDEMAAHYAREILAFQPEGPYYLAGFSAGGIWAVEIARQLMAQDQEVALLALIDSLFPGQTKLRPVWQRVGIHLQNFIRVDQDSKLAYAHARLNGLREKVRIRRQRILYNWHSRSSSHPGNSVDDIEEINRRALRNTYTPKPYPGRITYFRARDWNTRTYCCDPRLGWEKLALGGLEVHEVPGDHVGIFSEPLVRDLAHKLSLCMERARR
jgi:thioesterase domain-containing protein/acyl carrier protein